MNYMNSNPFKYSLLARNEGKIKSYDSCLDLRGWSHDNERKYSYLKEWIKCDMPISVIPASALICIVKNMTCYSKSMVAPRCHANCKSKVLLETICNSCYEIKECFKNDQAFDKYFEDEQFETSHWPCERCLEALKGLKMFWKIIVEKIFSIKLPKPDRVEQLSSCCVNNLRSVAKVWQKDMLRQTMFVKSFQPVHCNIYPVRVKSSSNILLKRSSKMIDTEDLSEFVNVNTFQKRSSNIHKVSRHTSTKFTATDHASSCTDLNDKLKTYEVNINCLREKLNTKYDEIQALKKENGCLKMELRTLYNNSWWKSCFYSSVVNSKKDDDTEKIPKPFDDSEYVDSKNGHRTKPIDSEMLITMKNCQNESYNHISLVQLIHKTNAPDASDLSVDEEVCCQKEDPIALLEKVQNTFGAIVNRELTRANESNRSQEVFNIDAFYHKAKGCQSDPSCSMTTLASCVSCCDSRLVQEM